MPLRRVALLILAGSLAGCPGPSSTTDTGIRPDAPFVMRCGLSDDPDGDTIPTDVEGTTDLDADGTANHLDPDADGDGISDAMEAGDADCATAPRDTDEDGTGDFLETDSNRDGDRDGTHGTRDTDGDGVVDDYDRDVDGDGIANWVEFGTGTTPVDTDRDGTPDLRDDDSDGDRILDRHEGQYDVDGDDVPNFQDLDSDGDTIPDVTEALDSVLETAPGSCSAEVDPLTCTTVGPGCVVQSDSVADFMDTDSDNDGLGDSEEVALGTDPCNIDTDGDGTGDLAEGAYEQYNCPGGTGTDCGCATSASCSIPARHFYVVLPYNAPPVERDLEFGTTIRVADVFFVTDTTGSMGGTLTNVKTTVAGAGGLITAINEIIPDAWVGGGQHDDFPFGGFGGGEDEPFILAIRMTAPERAADVQRAFNGMELHGGGDGPESQTEALFSIVNGRGGTWTSSGRSYTMPSYQGRCIDSGWGAPCFREGALPIIVLFTDICSHNGPPGESASCNPYSGISPAPATWTDMIAAMNRRGARFVGVNASGGRSCSMTVGPDGTSPCYFLRRTAEETRSVDFEGRPLVYDLPNSGTSTTVFRDTLVEAIETIATRVPLDVDTGLRDDTSDAEGVDARRFIRSRRPACRAGAERCWSAPEGVMHADAVAGYDESTFFGVVPGTRVNFRITFRNDFYQNPDGRTKLFVAFIDVRAGASSVLDTRQVFIVVPAGSAGPVG